MSTTNNTTTTANDDITFTEMFNRSGLKQLVVTHQHTIDYMGTVANIYNPIVTTLTSLTQVATKGKGLRARRE
jgi:hypothetical protein